MTQPPAPARPDHRKQRWSPVAIMKVAFASAAFLAMPSMPAIGIAAASQRPNEPIRAIQPATGLESRKVALGALLFDDRRLSGDNSVACTSCHRLASNGAAADAITRMPGRAPPTFNTPTVFNATANFRLGWRGNFRSLEAQTASLLENPSVMQADIATLVRRLQQDTVLSQRFRAAYGRPPDRAALFDAIASCERSLVTPGSRFDLWLQGSDTALSAQELRGYRTFKSIGCISCHQGVNVGGNLFQRSGIFAPVARDGTPILRVPSLRNVATTAPYFHDGSASTLPQAIKAMGTAQLGVALSPADVADIAAFLNTLTGKHQGRQLTAPQP
ncbi:cytochrome-c peroxidase [Xanthomonas vasicola]|uniref:cytochrome-c peroxidase n=1 Tax=Xanthomonas vasicola TaxID=56459 RepID=UPI0001CC0B68|nr:cytochrome c peroxidase [Xanthomonas vasicola]AZR30963.1 c-type cytochrome [Xanthomonas vasicola pv. musacearum NCPPB 4379]KFA05586.1 cytochrome C peroxidase [Xanthomonas vasicola pv. musacearum NCPPB 4380]KFA16758.1 cytochrome C peroxidase [Xanthomonas vasicola pv. musacearum NCPPB 4392]KFA18732.1 cytochrome C peroxidase [Xanthomonas vasicola pv. musacearum NCPPB 4394]MBV7278042.1 c-type cytochrome [Xanthomonas vasicola pv. musacearum]